jgi:hypothetical protein
MLYSGLFVLRARIPVTSRSARTIQPSELTLEPLPEGFGLSDDGAKRELLLC